MHITKAIIPVAGRGTRRLPITKVIEKSMLPIGNRPIVDYIVEDCLKAGITDIYFIVNAQSPQIRQYYSENDSLNHYLQERGRDDLLTLVQPSQSVIFHFIEQPDDGRYGTAIPVALAAEYIDDGESAIVLMGDDFIYNSDGSSETKRLIEAAGDGAAMLGVTVEREALGRYGVLELSEKGEYVRIVEKPKPEEAPSTLINVSKYVLTSDIIHATKDVPVDETSGEYFLPEVINQFVQRGGVVKVVPAQGEYLDGGSLEGWLYANNAVAGKA